MTTEPESPRIDGCPHPARGVLDFYLNGSLEKHEADMVRAHLAECGLCAAEADAVGAIVSGLERHRLDPSPGRARAMSFTWVHGLAASLVAIVAAAVLLGLQPGPGDGAGPAGPPAEVVLKLGTGTPRGEPSSAVVAIPPAAATLRITVQPPVMPGAAYAAWLTRGDVKVAEEAPLGALDPMGVGAVTFPARALDAAGEYALQLRVTEASGAARTYQYRFEVRRAGGGR